MARIVGAHGNAPAHKNNTQKSKKNEEQKKGSLFQGTLFRVIIEVSYRNLEQSS